MQRFSHKVVTKCFNMCLDETETRLRIIKNIFCLSNLFSLYRNKFGNKVIGYILQNLKPEEKHLIKEFLSKKLNDSSKQEKKVILSLLSFL